ncbi:hypothetical protein EDD11_003864 [Mortierella claussenii]|nr:hypothetical protein EDD11_003864 [Mortierella claussenii]
MASLMKIRNRSTALIRMTRSVSATSKSLVLSSATSSLHLQMIAIGGTIGTGIFLSSGGSIASAGPLGALISYTIVGTMVSFIITSLGELSAYLPLPSAFTSLGARFVDPALGFGLGVGYAFQWIITVTIEVYDQGSDLHHFHLFIIIGILVDTGAVGGNKIGDRNWHIGGAPIVGETARDRTVHIFTTCVWTFFGFGGTELIGISAGESSNPGKAVPKAIRQTFWRILPFYILSIATIGLCIPWTDENLTL